MRPPQGWKWRIVGKERYIVSPEGEMFKSIEKALAQMVKRRNKRRHFSICKEQNSCVVEEKRL